MRLPGPAVGCLLLALNLSGVGFSRAAAQAAALPAVNLGNTSFLDGVAGPGWLLEGIGQGVHDSRTLSDSGQAAPPATDVNSGSLLIHVAAITHRKVLGAWYGGEIVLSGAYVDTGGHGIGRGIGDVTLGPVVLQWPEHHVLGMSLYQRVVVDVDVPIGQYSRGDAVNIGNHAVDVHPFYAFTLFPTKKLETSWRLHYLWDGVNNSPPLASGYQNTQAGQAVHFNATTAYEVVPHVYLGANGYFLQQITDARANGIPLPNSKEMIGAIGPGVVVDRKKLLYYANAYHEIGGRNTTAGDKFVVRIEKIF